MSNAKILFCKCLVCVILIQLQVSDMSPDHDITNEREHHPHRSGPRHEVPHLVSVIQLAVGQLATPLAPHYTGAVWGSWVGKHSEHSEHCYP